MDPHPSYTGTRRGRPLFGAAILLGLAAGMHWPVVGILIAATLWVIVVFRLDPRVSRRSAELFSFGLIALWVARLV